MASILENGIYLTGVILLINILLIIVTPIVIFIVIFILSLIAEKKDNHKVNLEIMTDSTTVTHKEST